MSSAWVETRPFLVLVFSEVPKQAPSLGAGGANAENPNPIAMGCGDGYIGRLAGVKKEIPVGVA